MRNNDGGGGTYHRIDMLSQGVEDYGIFDKVISPLNHLSDHHDCMENSQTSNGKYPLTEKGESNSPSILLKLQLSPISFASSLTKNFINDISYDTDSKDSTRDDNINPADDINDTLSSSVCSSDENSELNTTFDYFCLPLKQIKRSFSSLKNSPRELFINFFLKFCDSYSYFCLSQILVILVHTEMGCSDVVAGMSYGLWATAGFFWSLVTSWINDNLGVRNSLLAGFSISIASTTLLVTTHSKVVLFVVLLFISPLSYSIGPPMLYVGKHAFFSIQSIRRVSVSFCRH